MLYAGRLVVSPAARVMFSFNVDGSGRAAIAGTVVIFRLQVHPEEEMRESRGRCSKGSHRMCVES